MVFDWDGTIADTMGYKRTNFIDLLAPFAPEKRDEIRDFHITNSGLPRRFLIIKTLEHICEQTPNSAEVEALSTNYTLMNLKSSINAKPFVDALEFIQLNSEKFLLFVSSSSDPEELTTVVAKMKMSHYFKEILGSRPGFSKGGEHFEFIQKKYDLDKNNIVFFGDDSKDLELGVNAQIRTILLNRHDQHEKNSNVISTFKDVKFS
jgi:phosphoglycolate phosphatase-like HAD superfamily hydrolase